MKKKEKNKIYNTIIKNSYEVLEGMEDENITGDNNFLEIGANSIDRAEIINLTLEDLELDVPRVGLAKANNINELVDAIYENSNEKA